MRPLATLLVVILLCGAVAAQQGFVLEDVSYDVGKGPRHPDYGETTADIFFPSGRSSASLRAAGLPPRAVLVILRGGNSNPPLGDPPQSSPLVEAALQRGLVVVQPRYPVVATGVGAVEDYKVAEAGVARLIQFLRWRARSLHLDAERIVCLGRSHGGINSAAVSWKDDRADPQARHPAERPSSRPDLSVIINAPADLRCFDPTAVPQVVEDLFILPPWDFSSAPDAMKAKDSPFWWLTHPEAFARTRTPPALFVYDLADQDPCGTWIDPHTGSSAAILWQAMDTYVGITGDLRTGQASAVLDAGALSEAALAAHVLDWVCATLPCR